MPEKPVLTREQRWAIEGTGATLIVSSAAGSGKTKVLVERFLYLVTEAPAPTDVDRILAVTFTDAAAAQLKSRIGQALREKWEATGEERLARQILLLDKAEVSTFHSFCHRVVRRNFHRVRRDSRSLGPDPGPGADGRGGSQEPEMLDPAFVVMDDGEGEILRREVLDEVFESEHARGDALFRDLLLRYGGRDLDQTSRRFPARPGPKARPVRSAGGRPSAPFSGAVSRSCWRAVHERVPGFRRGRWEFPIANSSVGRRPPRRAGSRPWTGKIRHRRSPPSGSSRPGSAGTFRRRTLPGGRRSAAPSTR
jgi:hypothetical protein